MATASGRNTIERISSATKLDVDVVRAVIESLIEQMTSRHETRVPGLGTFTVQTQKPRKLASPMVDKPIDVPKKKYVSFQADKSLKRAVNG